MNDGRTIKTFGEGDVFFARRNHLVKFTKVPPEGKEFRSITIRFDQPFLRNFSLEYGYKQESQVDTPAIGQLPAYIHIPG